MKKMFRNEKGFTLIELIIVIAILAIIAAVAIPNILGAVDNSRRSADVANAKIVLNAAAQVNAKNEEITPAAGSYDITDTNLALSGTVDTFEEALFVELNNSAPVPKYKGGTASADNFVLVVAADGTMVVQTDGGTEVAPNPSQTDYAQQ